MNLSNELQIGKAAEHLVCFDLIMQGYNAFLADQGLPFDIIVEKGGTLKTVQVKATAKMIQYQKHKRTNLYAFGTRASKGANRARKQDVDFFAFVALDIKVIAYFPSKSLIGENGFIKQTLDFKTHRCQYDKEQGKYIENYGVFKF